MKNKTTIEVTTCWDCPFRNTDYDDFALGDRDSHVCTILEKNWITNIINDNMNHIDYFIVFFKNGNVKSKNKKTLDNCPLLKQNINISLKKF
jgi:hypothetical protein